MTIDVNNLVLIPGLNNTKEIWDAVIEELPTSYNYYPITVPAISNMDELTDTVLNELPEKFHLVGFSFGGFLALSMLEKAPERITGLCLIGTSAEGESEEGRKLRKQSISRALLEYEEMVSAGVGRTFHPNSLENLDIQEVRKQMVKDYGAERYIAHTTALMERVDRHHVIKQNDIPYLFVASERDVVIPLEKTKEMTKFANNARFETVDQSGHLIPLEQPKELAKIITSWLE
ncbi:alpha/beta fold hydrolase [Ureibacillus manganicus]|uniref:AB hydrolase-1 domain-containing protein n=1 Tax=Ureibacillus manganicus DSM 26584 TaxID=1384049 RepID=A0A0A3IZ13_9BACL|nr:alpha/beta hydrolase [Ureibacillus manganicus]KGR80057.1 hypothetical protein CD29_03655 [Ureibacillus manganicus DSM 26584]